MKRYLINVFPWLVLTCLGCAGTNKTTVPLAVIDRPLVNPRGTWFAHPAVGGYVASEDSISYRGFNTANMLSVGYSLSDNFSLPLIPFPYFCWQITKSPLVDTTAKYKWQIAFSGGLSGYNPQLGISYDMQLFWKKRLTQSLWYQGGLFDGAWLASNRIDVVEYQPAEASSGIGIQLSPKADIIPSLMVSYFGNQNHPTRKYLSCTATFNFHYSFAQWASIDVGSFFEFYYRREMAAGTSIGGEFYW